MALLLTRNGTHHKPGPLARAWHSWPAFLARFYTRETWASLPGPLPVKVLLAVVLAAILAACQLIPGQADDIVVFWLLARFTRKNRR